MAKAFECVAANDEGVIAIPILRLRLTRPVARSNQNSGINQSKRRNVSVPKGERQALLSCHRATEKNKDYVVGKQCEAGSKSETLRERNRR